MVGRAVGDVHRPEARRRAPSTARPLLRYAGATSSTAAASSDVDLDVRAGEVVALYGKLGSGTGEVAEAAFGLAPLDRRARIELDGEPGRAARARRSAIAARRRAACPPTARREGAFMVPPGRREPRGAVVAAAGPAAAR